MMLQMSEEEGIFISSRRTKSFRWKGKYEATEKEMIVKIITIVEMEMNGNETIN